MTRRSVANFDVAAARSDVRILGTKRRNLNAVIEHAIFDKEIAVPRDTVMCSPRNGQTLEFALNEVTEPSVG